MEGRNRPSPRSRKLLLSQRVAGVSAHTARGSRLPCLLALLAVCAAVRGEVEHRINAQTGLSSWKAQHPGFSLELIQVVPDYVRAVYASRGLPPGLIERMAGYCVFGTILRNESDAPLAWRLADWRYIAADRQERRLKPKSEWLEEWREAGITFRWTLLADEQVYQVGDWGQGFITIELAPGEAFDLHYSWSQHDRTYHGKIEQARCAPADVAAP